MSTNLNDEDLDSYAENMAKIAAQRESRLQRLAMLKRQQLENDEEEFQKSTKKQALSRSDVISTSQSNISNSPLKLSNSPIKSPKKTTINFSSPCKQQFLPNLNSTHTSFLNTSFKSPKKDLFNLSTVNNDNIDLESPVNNQTTPLKQISPLKQTTNSANIYNLSPKPYSKSPGKSPIRSPIKPFMICHSPSQSSIASKFSNKIVNLDESTTSKSVISTSDILSPNSTSSELQSVNNKEPVKLLTNDKTPISTNSMSSSELQSVNKEPVKLVPTAKSSNSIKMVDPLKRITTTDDLVSTPEKLCVSDKKKLFEQAIKEETENAKKVQAQDQFLFGRKKISTGLSNNQESIPKKIKTSIFENKFINNDNNDENKNELTSKWSSKTRTEPKILDIEMKKSFKLNMIDDSIKPGDEISRLIEQQQDDTNYDVKFNESIKSPIKSSIKSSIKSPVKSPSKNVQFDTSVHLKDEIELDEKFNESNKEEDKKDESNYSIDYNGTNAEDDKSLNLQDDTNEEDDKSLNIQDETMQIDLNTNNLIKSSTKSNLYPDLFNLKEENIEQVEERKEIIKPDNKLNTQNNTPTITKEEQSKPLTPVMRTLSQYRREQKQRAAMYSTPIKKVEKSDDQVKQINDNEKWRLYCEELRDKLIRLKKQVEQYDEIMKQERKAKEACLSSNEHRGSKFQILTEKLLLLTAFKSHAYQQEIEKIKTKLKSTDYKVPVKPLVNGSIKINKIDIPCNSSFVVRQLSNEDPLNYYFICIVRCGEHVLETGILNAADSIQKGPTSFITFQSNKLKSNELDNFEIELNSQSNELIFNELDTDFEIELGIYQLVLPKDKKLHDKKLSLINSIKLPPLSPRLSRSKKQQQQQQNQLLTGSKDCSEIIKFTQFTCLGLIKLNVDNILDKIYEFEYAYPDGLPFDKHLELDLELNAKYNIELKDYLDFFEEVIDSNGNKYSTWKQRWCVLKGYYLAYWRYPEDEKIKPSIGSIDLRTCINNQIEAVSSIECQRANTFKLITVKEVSDSQLNDKQLKIKTVLDKNKMHKTVATQVQLLAAYTDDDLKIWLSNLNKLLPLIRIWDIKACPPQG